MAGVPPLDVKPVHQDPMAATGAHQADVRPEPDDLPVTAATGVLLAETKPITDAELQRRGHRHAVPSAAVTPVKLNEPRCSAGAR